MKSYKPKRNKNAKKFELHSNKRETRQERGYGKEWFAFRGRFLKQNKKCYACGSRENLHVDHLLNRKYYPDYAEEPTNFIPLCISCHSIVTGKFEKGKPDLEGKRDWLKNKRLETGTQVVVKIVPYFKRNLDNLKGRGV